MYVAIAYIDTYQSKDQILYVAKCVTECVSFLQNVLHFVHK